MNQAKTIDELERIRLEAWVKECIKCGIPPDDAAKLLEMKTLWERFAHIRKFLDEED